MAAYVKFQLEDGTLVYIESADSPKSSSGLLPPGKTGDHTEQGALNFDQSVTSVRKMAAALVSQMTSGFAETPEEMSVNFGLKASGEVGSLVVARGGMEANFNVMLRWHKGRDKQDDKDADEKQPAATEASATNAVAKKARKEDKSEAEAEEIAEE